jgi:transposase
LSNSEPSVSVRLVMAMDAQGLLQIIRTKAVGAHDKNLLTVADQLDSLFASKESDALAMHSKLNREQQARQEDYRQFERDRKKLEAELKEERQKRALVEEELRIRMAELFGKSSERWKPLETGQAYLFNEMEMLCSKPEDPEENEAPAQSVRKSSNKDKSRGKRDKLPDHLERITTIIDIPEEDRICPKCGDEKTVIGEQVSEQLQMKPIEFYVERIVRPSYACSCGEAGVVTAEVLSQIYPKSMLGDTVIAQIIASKYCDALPFYRQERVLARSDITISRQTMARAATAVAKEMKPLFDLIGEKLSECPVLCADETRLRVLNDKGIKKDGTSYMWVATGENGMSKLVRFYFEDGSRAAYTAKNLLGKFSGILMCDGYGAYPSAVKGLPVTLAACMAHVRRKFNDVLKGDRRNPHAAEAMKMIQDLYKIEKEASQLSADERLALRQEKARPIFDQFSAWLYQRAAEVLPKSTLGKAVSYAVNLLLRLEVYLENGAVPIDNNAAENAIRPFVVGRKNFLFHAETQGAKDSALLYSIIETAKANDLEPMHYMLFLFRCYRHFGPKQMPWKDLLPRADLVSYAESIGILWGFA